jgi:hypothetical protein
MISFILKIYIIYNLVTIIGICLNFIPLKSNVIHDMIFPFDIYWFLGAYLGLMIVSKLLNKLLDIIDKKDIPIIVFSILILSIYATEHDLGFVTNGGYSFIWAIAMYIVGGLVHKFNIKSKKSKYLYFLSAISLTSIVFAFHYAGNDYGSWNIYKYNNIIIVVESIALFIWVNSWNFKIINKKILKLIDFLRQHTLIVYLLHSTCWLSIIRKYPVTKMLDNGYFKLGILLLPIYCLLIYIVCSVISFIYNKSIQKIIDKVLNRMIE